MKKVITKTKDGIEIHKNFHQKYTTRSKVSNTKTIVTYEAFKDGKFGAAPTRKEAIAKLKKKLRRSSI